MPCDSLETLRAEERRRVEAERKKAIGEILDRIKAGEVNLVLDPVTGQICMDVPCPVVGMNDSCVLAGLAALQDYDFNMACAALGIAPQDLVTAHGHSH